METYAKSNAKWTDRTGAARGGLKHESKWEGTTLSIAIMHSVDYGLWLEVRDFPHAGRLAILEEARDSQIEGFLRMIKSILLKLLYHLHNNRWFRTLFYYMYK